MHDARDDDRLLAAFIAGDDEGMGALNQKMGVTIVEASAQRVVATRSAASTSLISDTWPLNSSGDLERLAL